MILDPSVLKPGDVIALPRLVVKSNGVGFATFDPEGSATGTFTVSLGHRFLENVARLVQLAPMVPPKAGDRVRLRSGDATYRLIAVDQGTAFMRAEKSGGAYLNSYDKLVKVED